MAEMIDRLRVHDLGLLRLHFAAIDVGHRLRMDDGIRRGLPHGFLRRARVGQVAHEVDGFPPTRRVVAREPDDASAGRQPRDQRLAKQPG